MWFDLTGNGVAGVGGGGICNNLAMRTSPLFTRAPPQYQDRLSGYRISIIKITRSWDRLIFIMGILILVRHIYIETDPWCLDCKVRKLWDIFFSYWSCWKTMLFWAILPWPWGDITTRCPFRATVFLGVVPTEQYSSWAAGLIPGLRPANEWRRYFVTRSLIGWAQA